MSHTLTIRIHDKLAHWLETTAKETGVSQGHIVREQLERARKENRRGKSFMRLAGVIKSDRDLSTRKGFSTS